MSVVTRFPPSPTGFMHIGNARTALYNWLYARHNNGKMLFRIEDTDRARHSEEAVLAIVNGIEWLGLDWDSDVISQFERQKRHVEVAQELLNKGMAYHCYCSKEELDEMRKKARKEGWPTFYDRRWRDRDPSEAPRGVKPVVRIKAPLAGESKIIDLVQGEVNVSHDNLDDFIILRSDGSPTYMLSVVVDDHDMGVTHVIRGDDHLNNTFRQNVIYDAMGWKLPVYAHLPLILGPDGSKMSKRHGGATVEEYRDMGILPEALFNYLLRLGWSHGDDEIISREDAIKWFDFDHVQKSAAKFDMAKLESLNTHYMKEADNERLLGLIKPLMLERYDIDLEADERGQKRIMAGMDELKDRAKNLIQLTDEASLFVIKTPYDFDEKARKTLGTDAIEVLQSLHQKFMAEDKLTAENVESTCRSIADEYCGGKLGKVAMPLRAAITGTTISPSVFHMCAILGKEEISARLDYALSSFSGSENPVQKTVS